MDYKRPQIGFENRKQSPIYIRSERDEMIADSLMEISKRPRKKYPKRKRTQSSEDRDRKLSKSLLRWLDS